MAHHLHLDGTGWHLPPDLVPIHTADGSCTLDSAEIQEHYHSLYGALTESRHVYITHGLQATGLRQLQLLEVGLGTGLNALLTWIACRETGLEVDYLALEPYPLPEQLWMRLDHPAVAGHAELAEGFKAMMTATPGEQLDLGDGFRFRWERQPVQDLACTEAFDLVYFDAFAPAVQPAMWTGAVFRKVHQAMRDGALLVTYCAKGDARRAMKATGFQAERLPGPPGKRHMLRARRTT
ncbi:MAG: tRNA (5-methylaminomethyl-2-thiouridine)(34)-methyltransferase MnmD [Flavobacteriales bacterium]|nr:tRNA (5-methylaminomethyl-2-thiouridine)(34)-methyltransferase MnmD [Flavobacteriales bacterium]MBP9080669.1 tRNA (5-methylaminomethyl-2-thiouridine)(34)-methyltransferase MnmD [Flavobacteriales bacterium]